MTASWAAVDEAIRADDTDRLAVLFGEMSEPDRKALWPDVARLFDLRYGRDSPYGRDLATVAVAAAWTAPNARVFSDHIWRGWSWHRAVECEVADTLEARGVGWVANVRLIGRHAVEVRWRLHRELFRRGLVERGDAVAYLEGMVFDISRPLRGPTLRDALVADPGLLQSEVYELFEHEQLGGLLGSTEEGSATTGVDPRANRWSWVLADLAREGQVDRARLLAAAHDAIVRDSTWPSRRWYALVIERVHPTLDELDTHQARYLQLLSAGTGPAVRFGQDGVRRLLGAGRIDADDFLRDAEGPLLRKEKRVALDQLALVAPFLDGEATRDEAAAVVGIALTHPNADVPRAALRLLEPRLSVLSDARREELQSLLTSSAPSVRAEAPDLRRPTAAPSGATGPTVEDTIAWAPPDPPPAPRTLDDDELAEGLLLLMGRRPFAALLFDEVLDGVLRRAGRDPADLAARLSPAVAHARRMVRYGHPVAALVLELVGETPRTGRSAWRRDPVVTGRLDECRARVRRRQPSLLLSLPTDGAGRLDPAVLDDRFRQLAPDAPDETGADRRVADLRAGRAETSLRPHPPEAWADPETYTVGTSFHIEGVGSPTGTWWRAWPHHVDSVIPFVLPKLRHDLEHQPTAATPSSLAPLCSWLVTLDAPLPAAGTAAVVLALSAGVAVTRVAGVDAVAAVLHRSHARVEDLAAASSAQVRAGVAKVNRLAVSLDDLRHVRAHWARDLAMATAAALVDHRDVAKLLVVAQDAAAVAGGVEVPPALVSLARSGRRSRAVSEALRLMAVLGEPAPAT